MGHHQLVISGVHCKLEYTMDKQIFVCGVLFAIAEVFAISSLFHVDWIHSGEDAGM